jgi:hypothetical protein
VGTLMNSTSSGPKPTNRNSKRKVEQKDMKLKAIIVCQCGVQILLMPDVKEMNLVLEMHMNEHKKNYQISDVKAEAILDDLIAQVLIKISQEY